jgi:sugar O-acyltransferase (sialic acid O-acetyltransferase NeuD family)
MTSDLYVIWGSSGHSKVMADIIWNKGGTILALFDSNTLASPSLPNVPLYCGDKEFEIWISMNASKISSTKGVIAIGGSKGLDRQSILKKFQFAGLTLPPLIHSSAVVSTQALLGAGSQVLASAVVAAGVIIGEASIINNSANIDHECQISRGVHIAPGAILCGCVTVLENAMIGARAVILPRLTIGEGSIVGAGSVVTKNVPNGAVVVGNPARIVRVQDV